LGGLAITKDIRSLNVLEEEAEALKIRYGSAIPDQDNEESVTVNNEQNSTWKIKLYDLNCIIEARVDEIVKNAWNMIQISGYSQDIKAGIIITGGGALLRNLPQFIKNQTGKEVRLAEAKVLTNQTGIYLTPASSCVVGLATLGNENCVKENLILTPFPSEKDKEKEREREREKERERKREKERERQLEKEIEREKQRERDREKQKEKEIEREKEIQRKKENEERRRREGDGKIIKGVKNLINRGIIGLFEDEDFDNNTNKPVENDFIKIQPDDEDFDNNTNKQ